MKERFGIRQAKEKFEKIRQEEIFQEIKLLQGENRVNN